MNSETAGQTLVERWVGTGTAIIAPVTLITALLFYYGYVWTRAFFQYFGIDVDLVGYSNQEYVMRSPRPLLVPLVMILIMLAGAIWAHLGMRRLIARRTAIPHIRHLAAWGAAIGGFLTLTGVIFIVIYPALRSRAVLDLLIPLFLAIGVALLAYGIYVRRSAARTESTWRPVHTVVAVLILAAITANLFWATATLARWSGRGAAVSQSHRTFELPSVILDTRERLYVLNPVIDEKTLPDDEGQSFRYRYRHLRLLAHGDDRMFLIPAEWSPSGTTLVVPLDERVRVQLQFENPG